jgi:hypothetical protein
MTVPSLGGKERSDEGESWSENFAYRKGWIGQRGAVLFGTGGGMGDTKSLNRERKLDGQMVMDG